MLNRIFLLQKRAVHALTIFDFRAHTAPLFTKLKILDIFKPNTFHSAKFMFHYHHKLLPSCFLDLFKFNSYIHSYNTRIASKYRPHVVSILNNILYYIKALKSGIHPHPIISSLTSFSSFKTKLFSYLQTK